MKNALTNASEVRQPRGLVKVNGAVVTGWTEFEAEQNEFYSPDTFRVSFAMSDLPKENGAAWFAAQGRLEVELFVGFPADPDHYSPGELTSIFFGVADEPSFEWDVLTIEITGRDLTADLIDHKTSEKYVNSTASQVATKLAQKYGLKPVVAATQTKVGRYYTRDLVNLQDDRTEWDLLTFLAREEGFAVYVKGRELHFEPKTAGKGEPYLIRYTPASADGPPTLNGVRLTTSRALTVARDIEVTVTSHNSKKKLSFKAVSRRSKTQKGPGAAGSVQKYSYSIPGLTQDQAQKRADQIRDELAKHEMKLRLEGPADNLLWITDAILLEGTGTAFDQTYFPQSIIRRLKAGDGEDGGYSWMVEAKNHSPESEPSL